MPANPRKAFAFLVFQIQLSNSPVLPAKLRPSRARIFPRELSDFLIGGSLKQKRERSAVKAQCIHRVLLRTRNRSCDRPVPPYGAPLRRLQSLVPHFLPAQQSPEREGVKDIDPRPHSGPGGVPPGTPGTTIAISRARAPIPIPIQFRLQDVPQRMGIRPPYSWDPTPSSNVKNYF